MERGLKIIISLFVIALLVGFIDSAFLTYKYVTADPINCLVFDGCNTVAESPLSKPLGVPLPVAGLIFYGAMGIVLAFFLCSREKKKLLRNLLFLGSVIGFVASLYFIYLQGFVIKAFCFYCLISAVASVVILCLTVLLPKESPPQQGEANSL